MVNILKKDAQNAYGVRNFIADKVEDVPTISVTSLSPGSTVFVIADSSTYMLNGSKLWVQIKVSPSGGGEVPPSKPESYDGGGVIPGVIPPDNYDGGNILSHSKKVK